MAAAKSEGRPQKKRLSSKAAAQAESLTLGPGATSSTSSAAPAPAKTAVAAVAPPVAAQAAAPAVPAVSVAPAPAQTASPAQQQTAAPVPDPQASNESGFTARLVRLDLLPDRGQDGKPPSVVGLPWESDASLHPPGTFSTPSVIYLGAQPEVKVGRNPVQCAVVLDCPEVPQMISRVHARIVCAEGTWVLTDEKSVNGVLVNSTSVQAPKVLRGGDVVCFGRHIADRPVFEYLFEEKTSTPLAEPVAESAGGEGSTTRNCSIDGSLAVELRTASQEAENRMQEAESQRQDAKRKRSSVDLQELQAELVCSVCQDWIVHASSLECGHSFCRECIDQWLTGKKFECPVCRGPVLREPTFSRALDIIVEKGVQGSSEGSFAEFQTRVEAADGRASKRQKHLSQLQDSVKEALSKGKAFFHVESNWSRREKGVFDKGIKDYIGEAREVYCQLIGLTVSWIHSASEQKLNQALHNVGLARDYADKPEKEIRQRLLMFLRYG